jgi:hypothetical protein
MENVPRGSDGRRLFSPAFKLEQVARLVRGEVAISELSREKSTSAFNELPRSSAPAQPTRWPPPPALRGPAYVPGSVVGGGRHLGRTLPLVGFPSDCLCWLVAPLTPGAGVTVAGSAGGPEGVNMRRFLFVAGALLICCAAPDAFAGRIFGDIKLDGKPVPAGLTVTIATALPPAAPGAKPKPKPAPVLADSTATDKFGSYKLNVKEEGKCILTLVYEKQPVTLEVFSYKQATRYDLILEKKDGKLSLRRK